MVGIRVIKRQGFTPYISPHQNNGIDVCLALTAL